MSEFFKVQNMQGYDRYRSPHWQMVPLMGWRYIGLRGGAGQAVVSTNPDVCSVTELKLSDVPSPHEPLQAGDRVFLLFGKKKGSIFIMASGGSSGPVNLEVTVKKAVTYTATFTCISDGAKFVTSRVPASATAWVATINYVLNGQANIFVEKRFARARTISKNLGTILTTTSTGVGEEAHIYPEGDTHSDVNVFLVKALNITDLSGNEHGFTDGSNIVMEDTADTQFGETLAHEFGHFLGLDDQYSIQRELMYGITTVRGAHLPKDHVDTINP